MLVDKNHAPAEKKRQVGFSLLEILVAMIVLAIGLLGLAGLQAVSLTRNNDSYYRQQAVMLAYDMVDRMRANISGVRDPTQPTPGNPNNFSFYHMTSVTPTGSSATCPCTPAVLANNDLIDWSNTVSAQLPGGVSIVCIDNTPDSLTTPPTPVAPQCDTGLASPPISPIGTLYAVKIWWNEKERDATGGVSQKLFSMSFRP